MDLTPSPFLLCQASELCTYANGLVHPQFSFDVPDIFFAEIFKSVSRKEQLPKCVNNQFVAAETRKFREGFAITRLREAEGTGVGKASAGAFEALGELADLL